MYVEQNFPFYYNISLYCLLAVTPLESYSGTLGVRRRGDHPPPYNSSFIMIKYSISLSDNFIIITFSKASYNMAFS